MMLLRETRQWVPGLKRSLAFSRTCTNTTFSREFEPYESHEDTEEPKEEDLKLYPEHIPTSTFQKAILAVGSAVAALNNPWRGDMVAVNGEVTGQIALRRMRAKMASNAEGQQILVDRPRIQTSTVDMDHLRSLPPNTLGNVYFRYNEKHKISPDEREIVHFVDDSELAFVMQRYREVHDVIHSVLDMPTNMVGEVAVKWVEALQTGLPMCVGGAIFGPLRFTPKQIEQYRKVLPWAINVGKNSKFLQSVYYEKRWEQDLFDFRREMKIPPLLLSK